MRLNYGNFANGQKTPAHFAQVFFISFAARLIVCMQLGKAAIAPLYRLTFYHNNIRPDQT